MRTLRPAGILAAGILIVAAAGCDQTPTAVDDHAATTALFSNSGQSTVELCHRTSSGDYVKITVADAAYDTHMAHGDLDVGPTGLCGATSRLTLHVNGGYGAGAFVSVTVAAFGGVPETRLDDCPEGETCYYDVPAGATVHLASEHYYEFGWTEWELCGFGNSCVMDGDRTAWAFNY